MVGERGLAPPRLTDSRSVGSAIPSEPLARKWCSRPESHRQPGRALDLNSRVALRRVAITCALYYSGCANNFGAKQWACENGKLGASGRRPPVSAQGMTKQPPEPYWSSADCSVGSEKRRHGTRHVAAGVLEFAGSLKATTTAIRFGSNGIWLFPEELHMLTITTDKSVHRQQGDVVAVESIVSTNGAGNAFPMNLESLRLHSLCKSLDCAFQRRCFFGHKYGSAFPLPNPIDRHCFPMVVGLLTARCDSAGFTGSASWRANQAVPRGRRATAATLWSRAKDQMRPIARRASVRAQDHRHRRELQNRLLWK